MTERRRLYAGEETADRGLRILRLAALGGFLLTLLFILFFERAKHDPGLAAVNPFAGDPYDAVGSFGVQVGFVCAALALLRAFRTNLKNDSLYNRYTYTLRSIAASQLAIIVTMLGNLLACSLNPNLWIGSTEGRFLVIFAAGLFVIAAAYCRYLIRLANRREVCSKNPLRQKQILPVVMLLVLLGVYPAGWREGIAGAVITAVAGMTFLFLAVALLSKAMFPCPDVPERDFLDDLNGLFRDIKVRPGFLSRLASSSGGFAAAPAIKRMREILNPRSHAWRCIVIAGVFVGILLALVELIGIGGSPGMGQVVLVALVYVALESTGVIVGFALLRRFLGLIRFENARY